MARQPRSTIPNRLSIALVENTSHVVVQRDATIGAVDNSAAVATKASGQAITPSAAAIPKHKVDVKHNELRFRHGKHPKRNRYNKLSDSFYLTFRILDETELLLQLSSDFLDDRFL